MFSLSLLHHWSQFTNASDRFTAYIDIFDTSIIVPVYLYNFFFVNLVFFVLGSSLLDALFSLCSLRSMKVRMKAIGNSRNISLE